MATASFYYKYLPEGNSDEFPGIDAYLRRYGVKWEFCDSENGDRIYRLTKGERCKLPWEDGEPMLYSDEDEQYGYPMHQDASIETLASCPWQKGE